MTQYILIALVALAILAYVGWRLVATDIDTSLNAERLVPDGKDWFHFVPQDIYIFKP